MRRCPLALALVLALSLPALAASPAAAVSSVGQFVLRCAYSHSLMDDPIVAPGQPGASHLHDFFGNTTTDASSTLDSLLRGSTTCRAPSDTAAYWTPAAYLNDTRVVPTVMRIYYLGSRTRRVETIPAGLQIIGGNKTALTAAENPHVSWNCGQTTAVRTPRADAPYDCAPWSSYGFVDGVIGSIDLPNCWDGRGLRPEDVVYPVSGSCPEGFAHVLPKLSERVHFGIMNPLNPDGSVALSLASGPYYTLHADFWNSWQQERLDQLVAGCLVAAVHCGSVDATYRVEWTDEFGTRRYDMALAVAPDGEGGTYVAGFTNLALAGQTYRHRSDAFLRRYDATGTELWTREFGTSGTDRALAVAAEGSAVFVAGETDGRFPRQRASGGVDAFVARFDADGTKGWLRQFGTRRDDEAAAVGASATAVYVAGSTGGRLAGRAAGSPLDAFVTRLDPADGGSVWTTQLGGGGTDRATALALWHHSLYVAGSSDGGLRGPADGEADSFVAGLDADGGTTWVRDVGGPGEDSATSVAVRSENVFVAGWTDGTIPGQASAGGRDAYLGRLGSDGTVAWTRQFGSSAADDAASVALSGKGVYVTGSTLGALAGSSSLGESDGFVRKYLLLKGTDIWTWQFGTADYDRVASAAADAGGVFVAGTTHGALEGQANAGDRDAFVVRTVFA
jgi:Domain of unknown function (DUF1996)